MARTKIGKRIAAEMDVTREVEQYEGGCFYGDGVILCRDPEYGYGMTVMALSFERQALHEAVEIEMGHRVGAWFELADDAYTGWWHATEGGRFLAALWDCPGALAERAG